MTAPAHAAPALTPELASEAKCYWDQFAEAIPRPPPGTVLEEAHRHNLIRVCACSPFVAHYFAKDPRRLTQLLESGDLDRGFGEQEYPERIKRAVAGAPDQAALMRALRQARYREFVRITWRDITAAADLDETMGDLSRFADAALDGALGWLYRRQVETFGVPRDTDGTAQSLVVIAMGKLGAHELNFSSDVDLIFAYPRAGESHGGARSISNQEIFSRLGQALIKVLSEVTEDGFVFRADMRLRPFGDSGPLVLNFDAMEAYYVTHGRDWERYAMIKARIAAGDKPAGESLLERLKPFVYRRYLDFGAIEALRDMKRSIDSEVKRKGLADNIKLGRGGIREIEFIGQTFQLIRGGHRPALRDRRILAVLESLGNLNYLPMSAVAELTEAYRFLRTTEHRLQQVEDQQTQVLPRAEIARQRAALGMGFSDWRSFHVALARHRKRVQTHFNALLVGPHDPAANGPPLMLAPWQRMADSASLLSWLEGAGFSDPPSILASIEKLSKSGGVRRLSSTDQGRLDRVLPKLLEAIARVAEQPTVTERLLTIVEAIAQRSVYLVLLDEHPGALEQLVRLCAASPWIANSIARQPLLLDELIDPRTLYAPPQVTDLKRDLAGQLAHFARGDLEQTMEVLRHFKHAQVLRVAAADVAGVLPVRKVSDHLTGIAETVLQAALEIARDAVAQRYGEPMCGDGAVRRMAGFAIIAYGKLGGIELGYGSDLDLVFLHDSCGDEQQTGGAVHQQEFFTRLGQRIIHMVTTATAAGKAYEVDTRLRPSGSAGLLVSSLDAYREYEQAHAWTWEHQALIRARAIAGDPNTVREFVHLRRAILSRPRDDERLRHDVREMRERMRRELSRDAPEVFDIKHGQGGVTDIEFMVQYAVLRWSAQHPELVDFTDSRHLLELLSRLRLLSDEDCRALQEAYFAYRAKLHALALQERPALADTTEFSAQRARVGEAWRRVVGA
ncbi:MAG: bifunctional [glutamate--ammonia ligase]-adenylyl-L-tyrosine phosphorylase/[glutamate--ammonia-ligase] adenylyltransferase [Gammaproteobacteria bacterium]|nr:bifunctional [glutamate--ammonia ligase]-adenylyl-L-tyrosine phosphorylase/[glutamate--ammonia-ligase] adenylyltransferase [Gammaproteobacteria bacterium]